MSDKRRKVTAQDGGSATSFTLKIQRPTAASEDAELIEDDSAAAPPSRSSRRRNDDDEEYEPTAAADTEAASSSSAAARHAAARKSRAKKGGGESAAISLDSATARATNRQSAAARASMHDDGEDEEEVYVDVLDDTEDHRASSLATHDYSHLPLKADHASRPIWVCEDGRVFLETYNPLYRQAYDFLIAIADPVTRPQFVHEYQITSYSLYAAASLGLETDDIISGLQRMSKVQLSEELRAFITEKTATCGKAKLLLKRTRYFVESVYTDTLDALLSNPTIAAARVDHLPKPSAEQLAAEKAKVPVTTNYALMEEAKKRNWDQRVVLAAAPPRPGTTAAAAAAAAAEEPEPRDEATGYLVASGSDEGSILLPGTASSGSKARAADSKRAMGIDEQSARAIQDELAPQKIYSFEISANSVEEVRKTCNDMNYGMLEEYAFRSDRATPDLPIQLRPIALIRDYQEKSLSKMFGNGRARSGIIVLPCGAGKCWGRGTQMLMFDGSVKRVEDIEEGEALMGDDSTPRIVRPGSITRGNTARDAAAAAALHQSAHPAAPAPATYRVTSSLKQHAPWTCNGDHILVLRITQQPAVEQIASGYAVTAWQLREHKQLDGSIVAAPCKIALQSASSCRRQAELFLASWTAANGATSPLEWETTVNAFMQYSQEMQALCCMFKPQRVEFPKIDRCALSSSLQSRFAAEQLNQLALSAEQCCHAFTIERVAHADYFGFSLMSATGGPCNGRLLFADFTVTHNTLVGITALATIKKSTLIMCNTGVSVEQWKQQVEKWSTLPPKYIATFTATNKDRFQTDALVVISTYNMLAFQGQRSAEAERIMDMISKQEWGLIILDEVHVAPAKMFRRAISTTHSRCKLGLTATLVREDELIDDLFFLIGPKLYEANWLDLQKAGYIATVQCIEVQTPLTAEFYAAYLSATLHKQLLLYVMNPNKFRAAEYLIRLHESKGDKVLVFSDNVFALKTYALALNKPMIYGATTDAERMQFLHHFQHDPKMNTLFISKVGDTSIDLPDVNVIIQISSHFSSRRQEAQRLGRILRPKNAASGRFNAFFYTLVSTDTKEMLYSSKRQRFLVDQGYSFKVVTELKDIANIPDLKFSTKREQLEMLAKVLATDDEQGTEEVQEDDPFASLQKAKNKKLAASRRRGNAQALSGSNDRAYHEYEERREAAKAVPQKSRHNLFQSRAQQIKEDARAAK